MQVATKLFALAVLVAAAANASPATETRQKGVTVCREVDFGGPCMFLPIAPGCRSIRQNDNDQISSLRADEGVTCDFYEDYDCKGASINLGSGIPDLRPYGWNDKISSYTCRLE